MIEERRQGKATVVSCGGVDLFVIESGVAFIPPSVLHRSATTHYRAGSVVVPAGDTFIPFSSPLLSDKYKLLVDAYDDESNVPYTSISRQVDGFWIKGVIKTATVEYAAFPRV